MRTILNRQVGILVRKRLPDAKSSHMRPDGRHRCGAPRSRLQSALWRLFQVCRGGPGCGALALIFPQRKGLAW